MIRIDDCQGVGYPCTGFQEQHEMRVDAIVLYTQSEKEDETKEFFCLECLMELVRTMDDEIDSLYEYR
jgi:hypothetical protein